MDLQQTQEGKQQLSTLNSKKTIPNAQMNPWSFKNY
jgi:hypothetical protein